MITKATVMDNFDQISTDPAVRLADLQAYLDTLHGDQPFLGTYWVAATSGSSGRKSIIPASAREWAMIIASYGRANEWAGIRSGPAHRISMAVVSSTTAWHQSSRVAATVRSPFIASERLDAASPLPAIVARLNDLQPDVLVAYASMIRALAGEQLAGRLRIAPQAVNSSSEVLTAEARAMATRAWQVPVFNVYAATETGGIAAECHQRRGMHLFEDLVIPEVVDNAYRPVVPGRTGDRLLVTSAVQPHPPAHPLRNDRPRPARHPALPVWTTVPAARLDRGTHRRRPRPAGPGRRPRPGPSGRVPPSPRPARRGRMADPPARQPATRAGRWPRQRLRPRCHRTGGTGRHHRRGAATRP